MLLNLGGGALHAAPRNFLQLRTHYSCVADAGGAVLQLNEMKVLCVFVLLWAAAVSLQARGIRRRKSVYHPASRRPRSEKWVWLLDENFKAVSTGIEIHVYSAEFWFC